MAESSDDLVPRILADRYPDIRAQYPSEGRRRRILRIAEQFWSLDSNSRAALLQALPALDEDAIDIENADFTTDFDPSDSVLLLPEIGILIRTDFSDDAAWEAFYSRLQEEEREFNIDQMSESAAASAPSPHSGGEEDMDDSEDDASGSHDRQTQAIFTVINPSDVQDRASLTGISNIAALRLFADLAIRAAPPLPAGAKRVYPPHRLLDHDGWQEVYEGKDIWIYDARSNLDQSVRVVSRSGDMYGTATADSWRARVSHICELQVNVFSGAMKIDFGGLDRWDYAERRRNMEESLLPITQ